MICTLKIPVFIFCIFICGIISVTAEENKLWRDDCRCGMNYNLADGSPGECNPRSSKPCCSDYIEGWCGNTDLHCYCLGCIDYRDPIHEDPELVEVTQTEAIKICYEKLDVGPCQERHRRWWYNTTALKCQIFYWSACHGNRNNFKSRYECEHTCFNIENYRNETIGGPGTNNTTETGGSSFIINNLCLHVRCRPGAGCNKTTGECECKPGYTGDPMSYAGCHKILRVIYVIMELRQCPSGRLNKIIEGPFCNDLFMTRQQEPCNYTNDVGYKDDSTTMQYMECKDVHLVEGKCQVVEEFTGLDDLTTDIKLKITIEEGLLKKPIMQYIKEQLKLLPGIFDPAANSLIWLKRALGSSQIIAIKWDSIRIEAGNVKEHVVPTSQPITINETFVSYMCQDLVVDGICSDLLKEDNIYCHTDTGDDLCRKTCGGCEPYGGNETCFNTVDFCRELVKRDACNTHRKDMTILCPYTCGFCNEKADMYAPGGICGDLNNNCALIRDTYGCGNKYVTYHKQHLQCQKTCGLCKPPVSPVEIRTPKNNKMNRKIKFEEEGEYYIEEAQYLEYETVADNHLYELKPNPVN